VITFVLVALVVYLFLCNWRLVAIVGVIGYILGQFHH
jgi:hypothetical protein